MTGVQSCQPSTGRPATIVISDWLANCQVGQWTPFEAAMALKAALKMEGFSIVRDSYIEELEAALQSEKAP